MNNHNEWSHSHSTHTTAVICLKSNSLLTNPKSEVKLRYAKTTVNNVIG